MTGGGWWNRKRSYHKNWALDLTGCAQTAWLLLQTTSIQVFDGE